MNITVMMLLKEMSVKWRWNRKSKPLLIQYFGRLKVSRLVMLPVEVETYRKSIPMVITPFTNKLITRLFIKAKVA